MIPKHQNSEIQAKHRGGAVDHLFGPPIIESRTSRVVSFVRGAQFFPSLGFIILFLYEYLARYVTSSILELTTILKQ